MPNLDAHVLHSGVGAKSNKGAEGRGVAEKAAVPVKAGKGECFWDATVFYD